MKLVVSNIEVRMDLFRLLSVARVYCISTDLMIKRDICYLSTCDIALLTDLMPKAIASIDINEILLQAISVS